MMRNTNKVTFLAFATSHPIMAFMVVNTICKTILAVPRVLKETAEAVKQIQEKGREMVNDGTFKKFLEDIDEVSTRRAPDAQPESTETKTENEETTEAPASEEEGESLLS